MYAFQRPHELGAVSRKFLVLAGVALALLLIAAFIVGQKLREESEGLIAAETVLENTVVCRRLGVEEAKLPACGRELQEVRGLHLHRIGRFGVGPN